MSVQIGKRDKKSIIILLWMILEVQKTRMLRGDSSGICKNVIVNYFYYISNDFPDSNA
ncbi:hypothetical protein GCM10010954_08150 [Halobacillus andaensis]|uniref:Uncharacterized protein n=1 Tax=Halobacillus andaensis TaxID=1176239 RepID=A0A917ET33_HALAA|nr:hypothetical protein GCM10010954_08150 [Halobacillus andaensis]